MIDVLRPLIVKFTSFAKDNLNFKKAPKLFLKNDSENSNCAFGKTAHYDPQQSAITVFITGRHPKDIIRSFAHELVHHCQNERGDLTPEKMKTLTKNYAQENDHMRNMEKEAYLLGNMCFRDWEDNLDNKLQYKMHLAEQKFLKENKNMSVKISKKDLKGLISNLLEKKMKQIEENGCGGKGKKEDDSTPPKKPGEDCCGQTNPPCGHKKVDEQHDNDGDGFDDGPGPGAFFKSYSPEQRVRFEACMEVTKTLMHPPRDEGPYGSTDGIDPARRKCSEMFPADLDDPRQPKGEGPELYEQADNDGDGTDDGLGPGYDASGKKLPMTKNVQNAALKTKNKAKRVAKDTTKKGKEEVKPENQQESKIQTPEQENTLYESRFSNRNTRLYDKLLKQWTK